MVYLVFFLKANHSIQFYFIQSVDLKGVAMLFWSLIVLPGGLDKRALIHEPMLDSAFPEASADLLWISTRATRTLMQRSGNVQSRKELV